MRELTENEIKTLKEENNFYENSDIFEFVCPYCNKHGLYIDFENDKNIECPDCDYKML